MTEIGKADGRRKGMNSEEEQASLPWEQVGPQWQRNDELVKMQSCCVI
jgi:hypothetical protein